VRRTLGDPPPQRIDTPAPWIMLRLRVAGLYEELQRQLSPAAFAAAEERAQSKSLHATVLELLAELQG